MDTINRPSRRRSRRWPVSWPTVLALGDKQFPCIIVDISELGAKVESLAGPLPRLPMKLLCDRFGSLDCRLIWNRRQFAGISFDLSPADVARILKPLVPWLDRRDQSARLAVAKASPKRLFGKKPRSAPSLEPSPVAKPSDHGPEAQLPITAAA